MNRNQVGNSARGATSNSSYKMKSVSTGVFLSTPNPEVVTSFAISLVKKPHIYRGYINGYRQSVAKITFRVNVFSSEKNIILKKAIHYYFSKMNVKNSNLLSEYDLIEYLGECICALQKFAGLPIFDAMQIHQADNTFTLWIPYFQEECIQYAAAFMLKFFNHHLEANTFTASQHLSDEINQLINIIKTIAPLGSNSLRLLQAAHNASIAWMHVEQNTFQYGYGRHSRWLDSTFTEKTSQISSNLSKNKRSATLLLKKAGFPVQEQRVVQSEEQALKYANEIGYPVVIKPNNLDGGRGVTAKLTSSTQVKKAYQHALKYSTSVLIEKHITGKDYRLLVFNGELVWAIERIPASVTGDGLRSIIELIEKENQNPERNETSQFLLKKLEVTEEVIDYLADQGYSLKSVLEAGVCVSLNRVANISAGGKPLAVFEQVHPDNKRLAEAVSKLFRLDVAGIDLIIPDIQQSYLTTGGVIIEINSQPQLGIITSEHLYKQLLTTVIPEAGKIPIIVVCGQASSENDVIKQYRERISGENNVYVVENGRGYVNNSLVYEGSSSFDAGQALLLNNAVDLLVYRVNGFEEIAQHGLPFSYYDKVVFDENLKDDDLYNYMNDTYVKYKSVHPERT